MCLKATQKLSKFVSVSWQWRENVRFLQLICFDAAIYSQICLFGFCMSAGGNISTTAVFCCHYRWGLLRCCCSCGPGRPSWLWCSSCWFNWFAEACPNVRQACREGLSLFVRPVETANAFGTWLLENRDRSPYSLHQCPKLVANAGRSKLHQYDSWAPPSRSCAGTCHPAGILGKVSWKTCRASYFFEGFGWCCGPREMHPTPLSRRWRPFEEEAAVSGDQRALGPRPWNRAWPEDCHPSPLQKTLVQFCWTLLLYKIPSGGIA